MKYSKKLLIGGKALQALGHDRHTEDTDFLIFDSAAEMFIHDEKNKIDYVNAAKHPLFAAIWKEEKNNEVASPQALAELKAFALVQHCQNFAFRKADACEHDLKFLAREFNVKAKAVAAYVRPGEFAEIQKATAKY